VDVWEKIHDKYSGATCYGDRLDMIYSMAPLPIHPSSITLIGEDPIKRSGMTLAPSDHLGLFSTFQL